MEVIVLGSGCAKCTKTAEIIEKVAAESGQNLTVTKETSPEVIMSFGVMSTPAVVVNGELVHSGRIPTQAEIKSWLDS